MSKFNVEDKVYLECEVKGMNTSKNTYLLRYRNWLDNEYETEVVKDDVLHTPDDVYNKGLNDLWNLTKKIVLSEGDGGYSLEEVGNIFGYRDLESILKVFTPQEALAKVKAYKEEHDEIKVGDVVRSKGCSVEGIVTKVYEIKIYRLFKDGSCDSIPTKAKEVLVKTGRHFDSIDEFMMSAD